MISDFLLPDGSLCPYAGDDRPFPVSAVTCVVDAIPMPDYMADLCYALERFWDQAADPQSQLACLEAAACVWPLIIAYLDRELPFAVVPLYRDGALSGLQFALPPAPAS